MITDRNHLIKKTSAPISKISTAQSRSNTKTPARVVQANPLQARIAIQPNTQQRNAQQQNSNLDQYSNRQQDSNRAVSQHPQMRVGSRFGTVTKPALELDSTTEFVLRSSPPLPLFHHPSYTSDRGIINWQGDLFFPEFTDPEGALPDHFPRTPQSLKCESISEAYDRIDSNRALMKGTDQSSVGQNTWNAIVEQLIANALAQQFRRDYDATAPRGAEIKQREMKGKEKSVAWDSGMHYEGSSQDDILVYQGVLPPQSHQCGIPQQPRAQLQVKQPQTHSLQ